MAINCDRVSVYDENVREVITIESPEFGTVAFIAIGATLVGSIHITAAPGAAKKGDEMGYFKFGGSTCVAVFEPGRIRLDDDLVANSDAQLETRIRMGDRVGVAATVTPSL